MALDGRADVAPLLPAQWRSVGRWQWQLNCVQCSSAHLCWALSDASIPGRWRMWRSWRTATSSLTSWGRTASATRTRCRCTRASTSSSGSFAARTARAPVSARRPCHLKRIHCCKATEARPACQRLCVHAAGQPGTVLLACDAARVAPLLVARPDIWVPAWQCLHPYACSHEMPAALATIPAARASSPSALSIWQLHGVCDVLAGCQQVRSQRTRCLTPWMHRT